MLKYVSSQEVAELKEKQARSAVSRANRKISERRFAAFAIMRKGTNDPFGRISAHDFEDSSHAHL